MKKMLQKKRCLSLKTFAVAVLMAIFAMPAKAQQTTVFMKDGSMTIQRNTGIVYFYDSHGASQQANYWEKWYNHNENFTYVFKPAIDGDKIKVTFLPYTAYAENPQNSNDPNGVSINQWVLRLNDDFLNVYQGVGAIEANKIVELTGNSQESFSVMSDGAITFKFTSNARYREEGWYAQVELVTGDIQPQAPFIRRATCSEQIEIHATTFNPDHIYYTIDGTSPYPEGPNPDDPLNSTLEYDPATPIDWPAGQNLTVKAISVIGENHSSTASVTFLDKTVSGNTVDWKDRVPVPGPATITREEGTNTIVMTPAVRPAGLNDTYVVRYTMSTNGTEPADPTFANSTLYTEPINCTQAGTIFKAKTFAVSCTNQMSEDAARLVVEGIYAPEPVIDFDAMTITAVEGETTFDILYTTNGSIPSVDPITGIYSATQVNLADLTPGQTVQALAYRANNDADHTPNTEYIASQVVSVIYVPTGGNNVYGNTVLLDDRENHDWVYYSDENSPIHRLSPADVKITYTGYGAKTMTSTNTQNMPTPYNGNNSVFNADVDASQVAVNVGESGNQFIYLKTLENAEEDGSGNYPYTMIPNPFQKRPSYGTNTTTSYEKVTGSQTDWSGTYLLVYDYSTTVGYAFSGVNSSYQGTYTSVTKSNSGNTIASPGNAAILTIAPYSGNNAYYTIQINNGDYLYSAYSGFLTGSTATNGTYTYEGESQNYYCYFNVSYSNGAINIYCPQWSDNGSYYYIKFNTSSNYYIETTNTSGYSYPSLYKQTNTSSGDYRGFYAWRVKRLSSGLSIQDPESKATYGVGEIIYADQEVEFVTSKEDGNEVEFEALWAKAWVNDAANHASNNGNYKNAYERNFKVGSGSSLISNYDYPVTFTTLNPDGSGTVSSASTGSMACSADYKFENMTLSANGLHGNNHSLHIGRGVSNGSNNVVSRISGYELSGSVAANSFTLRIESGRYSSAYLFYRGSAASVTTANATWNMILGSDYDRAKNDNDKLVIAGAVEVGYNVACSETSSKINVVAMSGTLGTSGTAKELYVGYDNAQTNGLAYRNVEILGGVYLGGVSGGISSGAGVTTEVLKIRIKGGTFSQYVYGAGQYAAASGSRKMIITGGTFNCWVAGGCYGTNNSGGATTGDAYVYFGGDANMTNTDGVFGGGYGTAATSNNAYTINKSFVVAADEAQIAGSVYGGGNNGYNTDDAEVYVKGTTLTVAGSVFGGANKARSAATTTVTMKNGTVNNSVYGGANTSGTVAGLATVIINDGLVKGSVYGGGKGSGTTMSTNGTKVTVTGGTINKNIYGGGEEGVVNGATIVSFEGGSVTDIFGAGKGSSTQRANVAQGTTVNVKGGVVNGAVYGGGENGTVAYAANGNSNTTYKSTVTVSDGEVKGDVFGGGKDGTSQVPTTVNVTGGIIRQNVFAGAYGSHGSVYVAGLKTLNITGGRIYGSAYGGSRNANDGQTINATSGTATTSVVNISGGRIDQHVYAAGYYGQSFGSVYAFIGLNAINDAPNHSKTANFEYTKRSIIIGMSVWAGGDWGVFNGTFGAPTVTGNSNIYINGEGYETESNQTSSTNYMNIGGAIFGSGTSADAGAEERTLILSNYGKDMLNTGDDKDVNPYAYASRQVTTIQRFHNVIFDDAHLGFTGQGKINSLNATEKYSLYEIDENVYLGNGSTIVVNYPASQLFSFHNVTIDDAYATSPTYTDVAYNGLGANGSSTDNKIRVNGGSYIEIKYVPEENSSTGGEGETLTYGFEDGTQGWTTIDADGNNTTWSRRNDNGYANSGSYFMRASSRYANIQQQDYLVSPQVTLGGSFSFYARRYNNNNQDSFRVYLSTGGNSSASDFTVELTNGDVTPGSTYTEYTYDLSSYSGQGYVAIVYTSRNLRYLYVDDITIVQPANSGSGSGSGDEVKPYGELSGFAHMMAGNPSNDATCAYARPKQSAEAGNILPSSASDYFNLDDGGWLSYRAKDNKYTIGGALVNDGNSDQLRYENHYPNMRNNSEYYRIWRHGGNKHNLEAVVTANADGSDSFDYVEVEVQLPSWGKTGSYYRFDRTEHTPYNTLIDYGEHVITYNGANYADEFSGNTWMYYGDNGNVVTGVGQSDPNIASALAAINQTPNLNYGLVMIPGNAMSGDNYLITSGTEPDQYLAGVEQAFPCTDNTQMPTIKLRVTYSNKISANATLDPVLIPLVQVGPDGKITDYVTIKLIINTTTQITSGFTTQIYARMDGRPQYEDLAVATVVLPSFTVHESGEESHFYLKKVEFKQGDEGVALLGGSTVTYAENADPANLNKDRFSMTFGVHENPDNTDDWRFPQGQKDGVVAGTYPNYNYLEWGDSNNHYNANNPSGVFLGQAAGRNPLAFAITLYYNPNDGVTAQSMMGEVVFTIEFDNYSGGDPNNDYKSTFTITVQVYRIGPGQNFYVDGHNGIDDNIKNRAKFPDLPAKTVNFIFNRLGFLPGDNIFVVDELPISKYTTWDGSRFQNEVNIYRYPGGHKYSDGSLPEEGNEPYLGNLVTVSNELTMKGITMDGMYAEATAPEGGIHNTSLYPTGEWGNCTFDGKAQAPLIEITNGGRLNLTSTTVMQNNYNDGTASVTNKGGAVKVSHDGILAMNMAATIADNYNVNAGGVYMDGAMIVSDSVYVFDNYTAPVSAKAGGTVKSNVFLAPVPDDEDERNFRVVQIGTSDADAYGEMQYPQESTNLEATKIGLTKTDWSHGYDGYMPVVYAENGTLDYLNEPYDGQKIFVHDGDLYKLERYVTQEYDDSPNFLYWLGTWVTAVTWNPYFDSKDDPDYTHYMTAEQLANINTPEQLAWVISLANGENGVDRTDEDYVFDNIVVTKDIDMSDNIWVPIGNESALFTSNFEGNGHVITGLRGTISRTDMGMFGRTEDATIQNMVVSTNFNSTAENLGTVVGMMTGNTVLSNVEGGGNNHNKLSSGNTGGLVGVNDGGIIHSTFAVPTISGGDNMGGLVAVNRGNLYNSYSNATMSDAASIGGLVCINNGIVENCYNASNASNVFAFENNGDINYCYAAAVGAGETITYVKNSGEESHLVGHGTYGAVLGRKELGYMYEDNKVTKVGSESNPYITPNDTLYYTGGKIEKWRGLLSTLNQWVEKMNGENSSLPNLKPFTSWYRSTSSYLTEVDSVSTVKAYINGDLPVLGFPKDNSMGTLDSDGKFLRYGSNVDMNGIDTLVGYYNVKADASSIFLYGIATDVENAPLEHVKAFINEDAVLLQKAQTSKDGESSYKPFTATVGITFDNSCRNAYDYYFNKLNYDWHMMATPLSDASLGAVYKDEADHGWDSYIDIQSMTDGYFPNGLPDSLNHAPRWDFYNYYEPEYHWINLKRNKNNHYHFDPINYVHERINYNEADQATGKFTLGKGYMMAVEKDSYMSSNGTLNNDNVTIKLTAKAPTETEYNRGWNLVGNPYMAYLDLQALYNAQLNPNISEAYVYDADLKVYTPFVQNASSNPTIIQRYVHAHQAFFVKYMRGEGDPDNMDLVFKPEMATATEGTYFRGDDDQVNYPLVNLFAENAVGNRDLAVIEFHRPELGGATKMNGLRNANFQIFARMNDNNYGLLFTPEGTERVPVWFTTEEDGVFTLSWNTLHGNFTSLRLIDNLTGVNYDMLANDSYTFEAKTSDYASRFYITYTCTGIDEYLDGDDNFAFFDGSEWIINGKGNLEVVDVLGRVLFAERLYNDQNRINLNGYAKGVYLIRISDNKNTRVQKIVVR